MAGALSDLRTLELGEDGEHPEHRAAGWGWVVVSKDCEAAPRPAR